MSMDDSTLRELHPLMLSAISLFENGRFTEAEKALRDALTIKEDLGEAHARLGAVLQRLGDLEQAEECLLRAIELEPFNGPPYYELVRARTIQKSDLPLLERFESAAANPRLRWRDKAAIEYSLGKGYNDLCEYERAIGHFDEANRVSLQAMNRTFDPARKADDFARAKASAAELGAAPAGSDSDMPIFVVGMMRSGTTLVEQILSSHSQISAGGEQNFWLSKAAPFFYARRLPDEREALSLGREYLDLMGGFADGRPRVTDKHPHNFMALGLIHAVFPNARIIHCRRSLIDSCLSIYMTPFRHSPDFCHSRENIVYFAKLYSHLMDFWREVLPPDRLLEIDYEELVSNPQEVVRNLIDFLGLPWEDACLSHETNPRTASTPSIWQVRQRIYKTSLERWRNYEPWLGVFRDLL